MTTEKVAEDIGNCIRQNIPWQKLPIHLRQILHNNQRDYKKFVFNYSLKNQLRFRGNLASKVFHREQRYYELLVQKSINSLCLFPYHLADIVTKGLRVTPFNYYLEVVSQLLRNDKSYDTLPNFTAADCLRILGIGRNEYLSLISDLKTHSSRSSLLFSSKPNPLTFLPRFPVRISIEPWWLVEIAYVLESDIRYVTALERSLIDDLIDFGSQTAGKCDCEVVHSLYRKGLIYLDVPISSEDRISIPPLRNFVMNRVSGDYFENLLYKIFLSADEHMTILELSQMLQVDLDSVKQAVSFLCRLGFAVLKESGFGIDIDQQQQAQYHHSWEVYRNEKLEFKEAPQITPLNYNALLDDMIEDESDAQQQQSGLEGDENDTVVRPHRRNSGRIWQVGNESPSHHINKNTNNIKLINSTDINANDKDGSMLGYLSSDGNNSDFSFAAMPSPKTSSGNKKHLESHDSKESCGPNPDYVECFVEHGFTLEVDELNDDTVKLNSKMMTTIDKTMSQGSSSSSTPTSSSAVTTGKKTSISPDKPNAKTGKRVGFLFDSTLTAFLMMGNLSPGLKNHAVTMFEVGKLCEESMDTFLSELEKVSLLDAEGEGDVSRYFAHAVILRSTICSLRHLLPGGLDLLRLECIECLDQKTRDRVLEKKYKFIISATPLTASLSHQFTIPFFGQFCRSSDYSHMWTRLFYNHITGYGPPCLFLCRGTVLKSLPRIFLGYGKLLISISHSDSYVINSENFRNLNDQLKNGCVLIQGYGIRTPGELHYEAFPFDDQDERQSKWLSHQAVQKLRALLDLEGHCGFITFLNTGVPDIGCEQYELAVHLKRLKVTNLSTVRPGYAESIANALPGGVVRTLGAQTLDTCSPNLEDTIAESLEKIDEKDILLNSTRNPSACMTTTSTATTTTTTTTATTKSTLTKGRATTTILPSVHQSSSTCSSNTSLSNCLKSPDENYFALTPKNSSPANVYTSDDCNALLATELAMCHAAMLQETPKNSDTLLPKSKSKSPELISQGSIEIPISSSIHTADEDMAGSTNSNIVELYNNTEEWTLLDVNFGVPLFDVDANTRICEHLARHLCRDENLIKIQKSAVAMNDLFMDFIRQCMYFEDEDYEQLRITKQLPHPRINLAFENGRICYWNGR